MASNTTLFQATQKFNGASCTSPLSLITYQFVTTCTAPTNGTSSTQQQPCLIDAPFATQGVCVGDYHANGLATFGSSAFAEVVIHSTSDCTSKSNIVGVRHYALNQIFEWGIEANKKIFSGVNLYDKAANKLTIAKCQDVGCATVFSDISDTFPADGTTCYRPSDLFQANAHVVTTVYNTGAASAAINPNPKYVRSSSAAPQFGIATVAVTAVLGFLLF
ncbi:hypothetical protein BDR26DRAFT_1010649 [Obelidium mucronatum]|nr:hypothetical protein BDR26DRAFT_1010649 [Obelidium mucronatum]